MHHTLRCSVLCTGSRTRQCGRRAFGAEPTCSLPPMLSTLGLGWCARLSGDPGEVTVTLGRRSRSPRVGSLRFGRGSTGANAVGSQPDRRLHKPPAWLGEENRSGVLSFYLWLERNDSLRVQSAFANKNLHIAVFFAYPRQSGVLHKVVP